MDEFLLVVNFAKHLVFLLLQLLPWFTFSKVGTLSVCWKSYLHDNNNSKNNNKNKNKNKNNKNKNNKNNKNNNNSKNKNKNKSKNNNNNNNNNNNTCMYTCIILLIYVIF